MSKWQEILRNNFSTFEDLIEFLEINAKDQLKLLRDPKFPINVPLRLAKKMGKNNINDPLFKQFVPIIDELLKSKGEKSDPLLENSFRVEQKLLQKYQGRALILGSSSCAMHCRFCFRQNFDYAREKKGFETELNKIKSDPTLSEIVLSGGDPLSLSDRSLEELLQNLDQIPHLKRIRFHTRFPIGIPERLDDKLLKILEGLSKQVYFIIHINHPNEWDNDLAKALKNVQKLGIPILSHTVLLKGINDSTTILQQLFETLVNHGIIPYYLNQLDQVNGTSHFEVSQEKGLELIKELKGKISGYAVPRYVQERPGCTSKSEIL